MILDSSAIVSILFKEAGYEALLSRLRAAEVVAVGAPTLVETGIVVSARLGHDARGLLARFLEESEVSVLPFTDAHFNVAIGAWLRYGKGRHPAALNLGDCYSYAIAKLADQPLLYVGDDFPRTDISLA